MIKVLKLTLLLSFLFSCSSIEKYSSKIGLSAPEKKQNHFFPLWFKNNDPEHQTGNLPIATNWPIIDKGIVYVGDNRGYMRAYELENGREVWSQFDAGTYSSAPVIYKDQIIYGTTQGRVFSRDKLSGKIRFKVDVGSSVETKALIHSGVAFFHLRDHKLLAMDASTGKVLWGYKRSVPYLTTVQRASRPLIRRNKVYVGFADGYLCAFRKEDGVLLWEKKISERNKFVDVDMTPVSFGKDLLVGSLAGNLSLINSNNGILKRRLPYTAARSPFIYKNLILVGTTGGDLVVLSKSFKEIKRISLSKASISSIVEWKNFFAVSTVSKDVHLVSKKSLVPVQAFGLGHSSSAIFGDMAVYKGHLAFLSSRNRLYIFK